MMLGRKHAWNDRKCGQLLEVLPWLLFSLRTALFSCYLWDSFWMRVRGLPAAKQQSDRTSQRWRTETCGPPAADGWCRGTPGALGQPGGTGLGLTWNSPLWRTETAMTAAADGVGMTGYSCVFSCWYIDLGLSPPTNHIANAFSRSRSNLEHLQSSTQQLCLALKLCAKDELHADPLFFQTPLSAALCLPLLLLCLAATHLPSF